MLRMHQNDGEPTGTCEVKVGSTNNIDRRIPEYDACAGGDEVLEWLFYYHTSCVKLVGESYVNQSENSPLTATEAIVHLKLKQLGAKLAPYPCPGCRKAHREFFDLAAAGGIDGVKLAMEETLAEVDEVGPK